jgi:hypothetical protein
MFVDRLRQSGAGHEQRAAVGIGQVPARLADPRSTTFPLVRIEPMTGIEPAYSAWEADVLPLNYIGLFDHEG